MPLSVVSSDQGNTVQIDDTILAAAEGLITLVGSGNEVIIEPGCSLYSASFFLAGRARIHIGPRCRLAHLEVHAGYGTELSVGAETVFTYRSRILMHEPSSVHVGQRCLIASETIFMTSDMHSIFDQQTGQRINPARSIVLGDDVWLGAEAAVMKGAKIGAGSAVGFRSIVTGEIPPGCVAAGTPARVLRESVRWRHELI
jgi:acetyltransferase-like isoleucine patch superfamily enzyme